MRLSLLIDNDVLIKCACYAMLDDIHPPNGKEGMVAVLGAAPYVVRSYLRRLGRINDRPSALDRFDAYISTVEILEPSEQELALATAIEEAAVLLGLDLDIGESQLCAIAVFRTSPLLLTGDKRAIRGAESLKQEIDVLSSLRGRVVCLEQVVSGIARKIGLLVARSRICAEPFVDRSLAICFACNSGSSLIGFSDAGLVSYIRDLRTQAQTLLYQIDSM
jgi:hypothetical protein